MPDIVIPFALRNAVKPTPADTAPRHRRHGYFDDIDQWHDGVDSPATVNS